MSNNYTSKQLRLLQSILAFEIAGFARVSAIGPNIRSIIGSQTKDRFLLMQEFEEYIKEVEASEDEAVLLAWEEGDGE